MIGDWMMKALSFGMKHPGAIGAAYGGAAGFVGSGFSGWGALAGATTGGLTAHRYSSYKMKDKGIMNRLSSKLGKRITASNPALASAFGPQTGKAGYQRNLGGKNLGAFQLGTTLGLGAGLATGIGTGIVSRTFGNSSYKSKRRDVPYGASFSGMGNGTVTGY